MKVSWDIFITGIIQQTYNIPKLYNFIIQLRLKDFNIVRDLQKVAVIFAHNQNHRKQESQMIVSKKQTKSYNTSRYNSKNAQNQNSTVFSHRAHDSAMQSLRNSGEKVLKLRGNSKNSGIKIVAQQKNQIAKQKITIQEHDIKYDSKFLNADLSKNKKYASNCNSNQSSNSSLFCSKETSINKKPNNVPGLKSKISFDISASFLKSNKQNIKIVQKPELQRKKSYSKGLNITKKSYNDASYFVQGYDSHTSKPNSARIQKPLAEKYIFLNLNGKNGQDKQAQKQNKISIDFDKFCNQKKKEQQNVTSKVNSSAINYFYSHRNSQSSCFQTSNPIDPTVQARKQKQSQKEQYQCQSMSKKPMKNSLSKYQDSFQVLSSIIGNSKQKHIAKTYKHSYQASLVQAQNPFNEQMKNLQPLKSHRVNNYLVEQSEKSSQKNQHKKIVQILKNSSTSKHYDEKQRLYQKSSKNYESIQTQRIGKKTQAQRKTQNQLTKYSPNSFSYDYVVGKGGFGKVWKVHCKRTNTVFALKQMSKALIISKKSVPSVMNQQQLLKNLKNPFIVNMCQSFQTRENLYLLMDFLSGGDLRHHLAVKKSFTEDQTKFIIMCILSGLKYLHENEIIHRDIKPQNIVLDEKGYARITDLGVARKWRQNNCADTSGTPGYMAPEVLCRQNHSYQVDYFAVGVIAYELMLRKRPYYGRSRKQIRDEVLAKQVQIKKQEIPENWSIEGADFINRMIQRKPSNRLGFNGLDQIYNHPWIRSFPFHRLEQKRLQSPYIPAMTSNNQSNLQNFSSSEDTQIKQLIAQNEIMLRQRQVQHLFSGYQHH